MPVVGLRGELVGVLSFDDLMEVIVGETQDMASAIRNERQIKGTRQLARQNSAAQGKGRLADIQPFVLARAAVAVPPRASGY